MNVKALRSLQTRHAFWRSRFWPVLVAVSMVVGIFFMWRAEIRRADESLNGRFHSLAVARATAIQLELDSVADVAIALSGLFNASQHVTRQEFNLMLRDYLAAHPDILSARWLPRVEADQRAQMEQAARADRKSDYVFRELDASGNLVVAAKRERYFPIYYMQPTGAQRNRLGFDAYSDPLRREAMDRARDSGEVVATAAYLMPEDARHIPHILLYRAQYANGARPGSVQERRALLTGFVSVQAQVPRMIDHAMRKLPQVGLNYLIIDEAPRDSGELRLLHVQAMRTSHAVIPTEAMIQQGLSRRIPLSMPGRQWHMLIAPTPLFYEVFSDSRANLVLGSGLIISLLTYLYLQANRRSLQSLHADAYHDPLTGLPNRKLLLDRLSHALAFTVRAQSRVAVFYLDLDGFKQVNDRYGHAAGDALLREVAHRLNTTLRASDTIARLGGDEFVVLAEDLHGEDEAGLLAEKILPALAAPYAIPEQVSISASIGICLYVQDGQSASDLLDQADAALYQAKRAGRNRYILHHQQAPQHD